MDPSVWLPWAWGAGAVICGAALCVLQPWRRQFMLARVAWRRNPLLWILPVVAVAAEALWQWVPPADNFSPSLANAALGTGDSLAGVLTWITRGEVMAMVMAAAFLANSAGLRRGLWKGIETVFPPGWQRVLRLAIVASATAALGMPAVRFGAGGESGLLAVKLMAALWTSTAATLFMCWLILSFESACRPASKAPKTPRIEMTAQLSARLWLFAAVGTVAFPLIDIVSADMQTVLRVYTWPLAALLAWFPLTALKSAHADEIHTVVSVSLRRWSAGAVAFTGWLAVAGTVFLLFHLATGWLISLCPAGSWWRAGAVLLSSATSTWLAVWMLGSWVVMQMERLPSAKLAARPLRRKALA